VVSPETGSPRPAKRRRGGAPNGGQSCTQDGNPAVATEPTEILRRHGYIDISNPAAQPDGSWAAAAAKELNGRKITVIVDRSGNVTERPPTSEAGH
jgi:hypothetical protein